MKRASFLSLMILMTFLFIASACKKKDNSVTIMVKGDTSFVSCPAIIVGGSAWKNKIGRSEMAATSNFKRELHIIHQTFPNDSARVAMIKTGHFAIEGGSEIFSFDKFNHYIFLASEDRKVRQILSASAEVDQIASVLGSDPVLAKEQPTSIPEMNAPSNEQERFEAKKKIEEEKMRQLADSVSKTGPQSAPVKTN